MTPLGAGTDRRKALLAILSDTPQSTMEIATRLQWPSGRVTSVLFAALQTGAVRVEYSGQTKNGTPRSMYALKKTTLDRNVSAEAECNRTQPQPAGRSVAPRIRPQLTAGAPSAGHIEPELHPK